MSVGVGRGVGVGGVSEMVRVIVVPWLAVVPAGMCWAITVPAATSGVGVVWMAALNPALCSAVVAWVRVWPITDGTVLRPLEVVTVIVVPRSACVPGAGVCVMIVSAGCGELVVDVSGLSR